jgi:hypothetical protein
MSNSASPGGAFDPAWYLAQYPDVAAYLAAGRQDGQGNPLDALSHYLKYGAAEGRRPNADTPGQAPVQYQQDKANMAAGGGTPRLNPTDPNSWSAWMDKAHAQTEGINRMPYMLGDTSQVGSNPMDVLAAFYGQGPQAQQINNARSDAAKLAMDQAGGSMASAQAPAADPLAGITPEMMNLLLRRVGGGVSNLGMGNAMSGGGS